MLGPCWDLNRLMSNVMEPCVALLSWLSKCQWLDWANICPTDLHLPNQLLSEASFCIVTMQTILSEQSISHLTQKIRLLKKPTILVDKDLYNKANLLDCDSEFLQGWHALARCPGADGQQTSNCIKRAVKALFLSVSANPLKGANSIRRIRNMYSGQRPLTFCRPDIYNISVQGLCWQNYKTWER